MNARNWIVGFALMMYGVVGIPLTSQAGNVSLQIENEAVRTNPASGSFNGSHTCAADNTKNYEILGSGTLTAVDGAGPDSVSFANLTIKATTAGACGLISFWTTVTPDPGGTVKLDAEANGNMRRPSTGYRGAVGSYICVSGYSQLSGQAENLLGGALYNCPQYNPPSQFETFNKPVTVSTTTSGQFSMKTYAGTIQTESVAIGSNATTLKGTIKFFLQNQNDELVISSGNGIKVMTAAGGGGNGTACNKAGNCNLPGLIDLVRQLQLDASRERLERIEKHLKLPSFKDPRPEPSPLKDGADLKNQ